jgi:adenylate cyclase
MCVSGVPLPHVDHAFRAIEQGLDMIQALDYINRKMGTNLKIRIGINTGPVVAGVIGSKKYLYDLWGDAVNVASRMESHGVADRVHISQSTYDAVKELGLYTFEDRGDMEVKGKGIMRTYFVSGIGHRAEYSPIIFSPLPKKAESFRIKNEGALVRAMSIRTTNNSVHEV